MFSSDEVITQAIDKGQAKVKLAIGAKLILGFFGGALIALGFLADVRVVAAVPKAWASFAPVLGAGVFPLGLIVILLMGGELVTGNMMVVSLSAYDHKVSWRDFLVNLLEITIMNFIGAACVAFFLGHVTGLTHAQPVQATVIAMAQSKITMPFWASLVSGVGCNWLVGISVWLAMAAKDGAGKMLGIWLPIMAFVAIGFQHSIANCFLIPAAIFEGGATWGQFVTNIIPVYLGNIIGGAGVVGGLYYLSLRKLR